MTLPAPPVVGERQTSTHDCGPASLASNLQWTGRTDTEVDVVDWMTANGLDKGATSPEGLFAYCRVHGIPCDWDYGNQPMTEYIPAAFARGHVVIGLHQCNGSAEPVAAGSSRVAHWRVFYGDADGSFQTMNPWEPELEAETQLEMLAADLRAHVEVMLPVAVDNTPTPNPPISVPMEDDMLYLFNAGAPGIFALYFGKYFHVTPDDLSAFEAIAVKPIQTIGAPGHAVLLATYGVPA